ncbi:MAG: glucokinase, partial [Pseudomonadota bacterium]
DAAGVFEMSSDGLPEASIFRLGAPPARHSQHWLVLLPSAARPDARSMLMVGLGGGVALEAAPPALERIDVIEIEPEIVAANAAIAADRRGEHLAHLAGPDDPLPRDDTVTVIGPGTGLGIAHYRGYRGKALIQATEGSHIDFAPVNAVDDAVLAALRCQYDRVSLERVVSGEGIAHIYSAIAALEGTEPSLSEPLEIWKTGMAEGSTLASKAVAHFVTTLGRVAGDYALAHGASAVVIAGGLGLRLHKQLAEPGFHRAFVNKGRYQDMMERMPIKLITHPQPGLLGAAAAYFQEVGV